MRNEHNKPDAEQREYEQRGDTIAKLLRLAGPRLSVPADRAARVRDDVERAWRQTVAQRRRTRFVLWSGAALATAGAIALGFGLMPRFSVPTPPAMEPAILVASLSAVSGDVQTPEDSDAAARRLRVGDTLLSGLALETGPGGRAALEMTSGASLRLDVGTRLRFVSERVLDLERGALYFDSGREASEHGAIEVRTPMGVVHDIGTQFEVRMWEHRLRVRVREGQINLDSADDSFAVGAGVELRLDPDGEISRHDVPVYGPVWDWVLAIAPSFSLEGHTLESFLGWVTRETGLEARFVDGAVGESAPEVVLHGSIEGLRPDQALEAVLPTCGLQHRVSGGTLTIEAEATE